MELYLNEIYYHWLIWVFFIFKRPILKVYLQMHLDANKAELDNKKHTTKFSYFIHCDVKIREQQHKIRPTTKFSTASIDTVSVLQL